MPHGESWFSFLPFYGALEHWLTDTFGPSYYAHTQHLGAQHVIAFAVIVALLTVIGFWVRARLSDPAKHLLPEGKLTFFAFIEMLTSSIYNLMVDLMGAQAARYFLPLIGACAFVIFFSNALGLIPGFLPPTDNLNTTAAMAIVIFIATHIYGIKEQGVHYLKHFMAPPLPFFGAGAPWYIKPFVFVFWLVLVIALNLLIPFIEVVSHLVRPVTLAIRLMANMTADHLVLGIFVSLFAGMATCSFLIPVPVAMYVMGTIVVTVQTLVFCLLSAIYIALAIQHEEEH